jgi:NCS1 family nucleobase:cation symporter-1
MFTRRVSSHRVGSTANGYIGATVHTPFAVTARSVYGYYGSRVIVVMRMIIACFWLSINTYQ